MKHVYLLQSLHVPNQFYVELTSNLVARLRKHNEGSSPHNHQGRGNLWLFPASEQTERVEGPVPCQERLGGLLYDYRDAARAY